MDEDLETLRESRAGVTDNIPGATVLPPRSRMVALTKVFARNSEARPDPRSGFPFGSLFLLPQPATVLELSPEVAAPGKSSLRGNGRE
jgi:hypothetical protein